MGEHFVVGVRYCGGCNPRYDRVAAVRRLREQFPYLDFCAAAPGQPLVLVICGCSARCAETADLDGTLVWLTDPGKSSGSVNQYMQDWVNAHIRGPSAADAQKSTRSEA